MEKIDYKKEFKQLYLPPKTPHIIDVPEMKFVAVRGVGNPNEEDGAYKQAVALLYAISFTIKMSKMSGCQPSGYFEYVVPPLEGFWGMADGSAGIDYEHKEQFSWISLIRLPEFVDKKVFDWAVEEVKNKKKLDCSKAQFLIYKEGLCVQCMHIGSFDDEPATILSMEQFLKANGYEEDFDGNRMHHEIYISDPRKCSSEKLKTVIRHPIRRVL